MSRNGPIVVLDTTTCKSILKALKTVKNHTGIDLKHCGLEESPCDRLSLYRSWETTRHSLKKSTPFRKSGWKCVILKFWEVC
uniref:Uncharacterized protein n=1 Tax=Ciona intestinalis TaxID=7719 RepID=H2XPY2_CIOIN